MHNMWDLKQKSGSDDMKQMGSVNINCSSDLSKQILLVTLEFYVKYDTNAFRQY